MLGLIKKVFFGSEIKGESQTQNSFPPSEVADLGVDELFDTARTSFENGDTVRALELYLSVIKKEPRHVKALTMLGFLYRERGNLAQAKIHLAHALDIDDASAEAHYLLGTIAAAENDSKVLVRCFQRSLALNPLQEHLYLEFSFALFQLTRAAEAVDLLKAGLVLYPQNLGMLQYLGNMQLRIGQLEAAHDTYARAIALQPDAIELRFNQFACCSQLAQFDEALEHLLHIQKIEPNHVLANAEEGLLRLRRGEYARGWQQYEWRWRIPELEKMKFNSNKPKWNGSQDLRGKTILILSEQGLGDTIQFCRFLPILKQQGAHIVFIVAEQLLNLLQQIGKIDEFTTLSNPKVHYDYYCELMSIPAAIGLTVESIPSRGAYLHCPQERKQKWAKILSAQQNRPRIGLVWSGNPNHAKDHLRSIPLEEVLALFNVDANFIVLHKELSDNQKSVLSHHNNVFFYGDEVSDFTDTAGLIDQMDLIVTVDTSVAHLAGAMGKNTWILLSYLPDWRWMEKTAVSPWYESVRLVRQEFMRPWSETIDKLRVELNEFVREKTQGGP